MIKQLSNTFSRPFLAGTVVVALLASQHAEAADLVVTAFGGVWEKTLKECVVAPFEKKTGKTVDVVLSTPGQALNQIAASPGKPPIDVAFLPPDNAVEAARRGLVERFDMKKVPQLSDVPVQFQDSDRNYVALNYGAMGVLYNSKRISVPPATWKEFVDGTIAGKWRASIPGMNYSGGPYVLWLMATQYGGSLQDISPGLAQIKRMVASGNLDLWSDPNQVLNALKSGDVDVAMYWDGRSWAFIDGGNKDFKYYTPQPGGVAAMTSIHKVKGSPDAAWDLIDFALTAESQSCFANRTRYGGTNPGVAYDAKIKPQITDLSLLLVPQYKQFPQFQSQWVEAWNKEVKR